MLLDFCANGYAPAVSLLQVFQYYKVHQYHTILKAKITIITSVTFISDEVSFNRRCGSWTSLPSIRNPGFINTIHLPTDASVTDARETMASGDILYYYILRRNIVSTPNV